MPGVAKRTAVSNELLTSLKSRLRASQVNEHARPSHFYSTGLQSLDAVLGGGLAAGEITEFTGKGSGGRTALALSLAAQVTRHSDEPSSTQSGCPVAWIDTEDRLDASSLRDAGAQVKNFLWMRGGGKGALKQSFKAVDVLLDSRGFPLIVLDLVESCWRKDIQRSAWWVRIARKLKGKDTALLVLAEQPTAFQPACRVACEPRRIFSEPVSFRVLRRGSGDVKWMYPVHLARPLR